MNSVIETEKLLCKVCVQQDEIHVAIANILTFEPNPLLSRLLRQRNRMMGMQETLRALLRALGHDPKSYHHYVTNKHLYL